MCPAVLDRDVLTFAITCFSKTLAECRYLRGVFGRLRIEEPNYRHRRLLRARRERPRGRCAEQRDELAPSNVTCHAPLPRRHAQSNNITSLFDLSRQLRWPRYVCLAFDIPISRAVNEVRPRYGQT